MLTNLRLLLLCAAIPLSAGADGNWHFLSQIQGGDSGEPLNKTVVQVEKTNPEKENEWSKALDGAFGLVLVYALCAYFSIINKELDDRKNEK